MTWRLLTYVLTAAIGVLPVAPPEHVHDVDHDGHHETVAHRHTEGHGRRASSGTGAADAARAEPAHHDPSGGHDDDSDDDHDTVAPGALDRVQVTTAIDDEDSVVAALSAPTWTLPSLEVPDAPATAVVAWILPPAPGTRVGHIDDVERLIHGPPRPTASLRGPPVLSRP